MTSVERLLGYENKSKMRIKAETYYKRHWVVRSAPSNCEIIKPTKNGVNKSGSQLGGEGIVNSHFYYNTIASSSRIRLARRMPFSPPDAVVHYSRGIAHYCKAHSSKTSNKVVR
jgi:hypothetical protein